MSDVDGLIQSTVLVLAFVAIFCVQCILILAFVTRGVEHWLPPHRRNMADIDEVDDDR